ncbi:MAG: hypothetical protein RR525_08125 [Cellulosilyticaceae bacterium]
MEYLVEIIILLCTGLGLLLLFRPTITKKDRQTLGIPFATPIYTDEKGTKLLIAPKLDLQGKPDYIFKTWIRGGYIPLEIKSGVVKEDEPHEGDLMQLVAYFLIIKEVYGKKPPYGKLVYKNKTFKVRNTLALRMTLKGHLRQMREMLKGRTDIEVETSYIKCRNCICQNTVCEVRGETESERR